MRAAPHSGRARDARLHLDTRPEFLDRMPRVTNVLDHLTAPMPVGAQGGGDTGFGAP
ncbi:hypothetical protein ABZT03_08170 [Streptomyces sp. NPDC005574]|uniref:hypothetical protein n=1 Tax=Streptomyces sp. NPDC005574 TaxID=3156891 RepID=UPI0033A67955